MLVFWRFIRIITAIFMFIESGSPARNGGAAFWPRPCLYSPPIMQTRWELLFEFTAIKMWDRGAVKGSRIRSGAWSLVIAVVLGGGGDQFGWIGEGFFRLCIGCGIWDGWDGVRWFFCRDCSKFLILNPFFFLNRIVVSIFWKFKILCV